MFKADLAESENIMFGVVVNWVHATIMSCLHWHVIFTMLVKLAHTFGILNIGGMVYNVST